MSGIIPRAFIDELLNRTDIVELIDSHIPLKKQGTSFVACCPFHQEKTPSFNVNAKKQFYHCFGCGVSGNAISFAMNYSHLSFPDTIETLAARAGMVVPRENNSPKREQSKNWHQLLDKISVFYQQQLNESHAQEAVQYLKQRGINADVAKQFQIGYSPAGWHALETAFKPYIKELIATGMLIQRDDGKIYDRYRQRVMYPIHDRHGRIIGFGGRSIDANQQPKYLNSPETPIFQKSRELYGLHHIIHQKSSIKNILIVEGYMDVIALVQFGIHNAVATLGTATSTYHIQLLSKYTQQLIFCFDGDAAGKQAAWRALENSLPHLNNGLDAKFIFLPEAHDPDSLVRQEGTAAFLNRIEHATPLHQMFFETLMRPIDISTLAGKSQLIQVVKPYLLKMNEGPYHQLILNELSRITRIDIDRLSQLTKAHTNENLSEHSHVIQRTPVRVAIALLLQNPGIYQDNQHLFTNEMIETLRQTTLQQLLHLIIQNPTINTGMLLESFRDAPEFDALNKLAGWDHQVPEGALVSECVDTLLFLTKQGQAQTVQQLIDKSRQHGLTEEERITLQQLLKLRHKPTINITHME
jgi:DNA primase